MAGLWSQLCAWQRRLCGSSRTTIALCAVLTLSILPAGCNWRRQARKQASSEQAEELARQARQAADRGDTGSAEYLLTAAVASNPRDSETRLELSEMLLEHGSLPAAANHLQHVVETSPEDPRGHVRLAQALFLQEKLLGAERELTKALDLDPSNAQAWVLKARIEHVNGREKDALEACYRALATEPDLAPARLLAAELHLARGNPQQATPLLRSLLDPGSANEAQRAEASWLLGICYAREGRWGDAATTLRTAVSRHGESAADWYQLAYACYRSGDNSGSREAVAKALEITPGHAESVALVKLLDTNTSPPAAPGTDRSGPAAPQVTHAR